MVPDMYTREKLALERRHTLLCEAQRERMLADASTQAAHILERLGQSLGLYLIALGTRLQRFGQRGQAVEYQAESSS